MPPKSKDFKPKSKSKTSSPQSEVDFLQAAEELEQGGGKWRAGDPAKAARFFHRAVQVYDEGLKKFPHSFDLAYNKAHLEYQICEEERIAVHIGSKISLLEETLDSHRAALELDPSNLDAQFNTAQVMSSLAEAMLETETQPRARTLLEEAAERLTHCLSAQQWQYQQLSLELAGGQAGQMEVSQGDTSTSSHPNQENDAQKDTDASSPTSPAMEEWATVEHTLTPEVILETCTALLNVLTTLIDLYDPADVATLEQQVQRGLYTVNIMIPSLISLVDAAPPPVVEDQPAGPTLSIASPSGTENLSSTPKDDALLAAAIFNVAVADISYRNGQITAPHYATIVSTSFSPLATNPRPPGERLALLNAKSAHVDALVELASTVGEASPETAADLEIQWSALTQAQQILAQLCAPPDSAIFSASRLADMFIARGDIDLSRFRLSRRDDAKAAWASSKTVLVSNAGVFYRGAKNYAGQPGGNEEVAKVARAKAAVAEILKHGTTSGDSGVAGKQSWKEQQVEIKSVLEQMVNEKTLSLQESEQVLSFVLA